MQKLLVIGYVWPEPKSSAAGSHILSLIEVFQYLGWQVVFASPATKSGFEADLSVMDIKAHTIKLNCDSFDSFCAETQPNAVLFDRFMMEEQFGWRVERACPNAIRILDTEDLQCLREVRHRLVKQCVEESQADAQSEGVKKDILCCDEVMNPDISQLSELALREIAAIIRSDLSLIISDFEYQWLQQSFQIPTQQLMHIPFLVEQPKRAFADYRARNHFVSIGNFRHAPNWDSVLQLKSIWPDIRKQLPSAELHVYGAYTPPKATALNDIKSGFLIKDRADSATEVVGNARVLLAPLRFGAGIKGKLMDAMLTGTPSITSPIGAEGMQLSADWPGAVVNSVTDFIEQAVKLYSSESAWNAAQDKILPTLTANFAKSNYRDKLQKALESMLSDIGQHRAGLFFNAMLRFHSMRSTEFMSRWIAAKNKLEEA